MWLPKLNINRLIEWIGIKRSEFIYYRKPGNASKMIRFYGTFINENDLCFDIGAHLGNRTDVWNKLGAKIIAVEPNPACANYMKKKFRNKENIEILNLAVSDRKGNIDFYINTYNPTISTCEDENWRREMNEFSLFGERWNDPITINATSINSLIQKFGIPDFVKIDVEGSELKIISALEWPIPHFSFEFIYPKMKNIEKILFKILSLGDYRFNFSLRERHQFEFPEYVSYDILTKKLNNLPYQLISGDIYAKITSSKGNLG